MPSQDIRWSIREHGHTRNGESCWKERFQFFAEMGGSLALRAEMLDWDRAQELVGLDLANALEDRFRSFG